MYKRQNIRYPYTYKDQVTEDFTARVAPEGIVVHEVDAHNTYRFPMDHPLIRTLRGVYEELTGKDSTPSHEGGTYAQVVPGIVPFGSIFPGTPDLERAMPVLEVLPGWKQDIRGIKRFEDLPENAQKYVKFIESLLDTPITMVSNGPGREDIIRR